MAWPKGKPFSADLTGQRFGRLVVVSRGPKPPGVTRAFWKCQCDCGAETVVSGKHLRSGNTRSCGCLRGAALKSFLAASTPEQRRARSLKGVSSRDPEVNRAGALKAQAVMRAKYGKPFAWLTPEQRRANGHKAGLTTRDRYTPEQRSERARRAVLSMTPEERSAAGRKGGTTTMARLTPEQRTRKAQEAGYRAGRVSLERAIERKRALIVELEAELRVL